MRAVICSNLKRLIFPLALLGLAVSGCLKGGFSQRHAAERTGVFRYALASDPPTLDPGKVQDVATIELLSDIFEGLVAYDQNNRIVPRIAASYESPDNGKTWIFKLRHGVKFHNGREVTAQDFAWTFERNCANDFGSPTAQDYLSDIAGVKDYEAGRTAHIAGIAVTDPYTLTISLDEPRPYFVGKLTYPCAFVLCKEAAGRTSMDQPSQVIGSGPFKLAGYAPDQLVTLVPNPLYYGGMPPITRIELPIIKDPASRLAQFKAGDLDILTIDRKDIEGVEQDSELKSQLQFQMRPAVFYIGVNETELPPLKDQHVRRALAMAVYRTRIDKDLLDGMPEAHGLVPPGVFSYRDGYRGLPNNPAGAKAELAEAGYPDGRGFPPIELAYRVDASDARICCEAVQESLVKNLNITVNVRTLDWGALLDARNKNKLQLYFLDWYADYLDPQNFLSFLLSSDSKLNHDGYSNPDFDALTKRADSLLDEGQRTALYNRAEDIAILDGARIPLYFQRDAILVSPRVTGYRSNLFGQLPDTAVRVR